MAADSGAAPSLRVLVLLAIPGVALVVLSVWLGQTFGEAPWSAIVSETVVSTCYLAAGLSAWRLRPRSRTGPWMYAMGTAMFVSDLNDGLMLPSTLPGRELITLFGSPASWVQLAIMGHLVLAYPSGRLTDRTDRRLATSAFVLAAVGSVLVLVTKTPVPICADWCGPSPVQLVAEPGLYLRIRTFLIGSWIVLALAAVVQLARRTIGAGPRRRRALALTAMMGSLAAALFIVSQVGVVAVYARQASTAVSAWSSLSTVWAAVVTVPVAFFVGLLRERLAFASVGILVARLQHVDAHTVEAGLAETLKDPCLRVVFPNSGQWLDIAGRPYHPARDAGRTLTPIGTPPTAALVHDPELTEDKPLLHAAASAAHLALDNARLHAEVRAQLSEVRASRQRLAAAADTERRRLERDLHDGAQQRLLGLGMALAALRSRLPSTDDREQVDRLEAELRAVIGELRELARGIRPAVLTDQGLAPALSGLARRAAVPVTLELRLGPRPAPVIEAAAYYVVSEALQNIVKHSPTARTRIQAVQREDLLVIEISDDGPGGARAAPGSGLQGLVDRVEAVGGRLSINSPPGGGTHLRTELPCA
ncbi:sensor histidine kinase [Streptomyces sp. NPDC021080]|uniref:sensor histidine kinase n=1 Tax=Streptomyces sp. NPDC021080 TaxID=3365110 RepID=UPI0037B010F7